MASPTARKLRYLRERVVNALWMIREGRLRQFVTALGAESRLRLNGGSGPAATQTPIAESIKATTDPCRIVPANSRPTRAGRPVAHADVASDTELVRAIAAYVVRDTVERKAAGNDFG